LSDLSIIIGEIIQELTIAEISFTMKLMIIFGVIYLSNMVMKTGGSIIHLLIYIIGFIKWCIYKILKKDV